MNESQKCAHRNKPGTTYIFLNEILEQVKYSYRRTDQWVNQDKV